MYNTWLALGHCTGSRCKADKATQCDIANTFMRTAKGTKYKGQVNVLTNFKQANCP